MSTITRRSTRRSEEELRALALEGSLLDDTDAVGVARWAAASFPGTLAVACSMAEGVLPHLVSQHAPGAVDQGRVLQIGRDGVEVGDGQPGRERYGEEEVDDDERRGIPVERQLLRDLEERDEEESRRN